MARGVLWIVLHLLPQIATALAGLLGVLSTSFMLGLARGARRVTGDGCSDARARGTAWVLMPDLE